MRTHILQHVPFEGPGNIETWINLKGYEMTSTHLYKLFQLPDPEKIDLLIIMGGPMSVNDEKNYPWLAEEKQFIRKCIETGKSVLGICLGSQMISSALGARVYPNSEKEIGWFPVQGITSQDPSIFRFPASFIPFHWHGETFDLPEGAVHIAKSEGCKNQAFQLGQSVIGIQFHPEITHELLKEMVLHGRDELVPANYVQSEGEILGVTTGKFEELQELMAGVLAFLTGKT